MARHSYEALHTSYNYETENMTVNLMSKVGTISLNFISGKSLGYFQWIHNKVAKVWQLALELAVGET